MAKETQLMIIAMGNTYFIGEVANEEFEVMKNPRQLFLMNRNQENFIVIHPILGEPEYIGVESFNFSFKPNKEITALYIENTTGIKLVEKIPS